MTWLTLKDRDTGVLDGPPIRYWMAGADEWRASGTWPPAGVTHRALALLADGVLADDEGPAGQRSLLVLGTGLARSRPSEADPPARLDWTSAAIPEALDVSGDIEVELHATATAIDTAWLVTLQDVAPNGTVVGANTTAQIDDAVASLDIELTADELAALERPYTPRYDFQFVSDEAELKKIREQIPGYANV